LFVSNLQAHADSSYTTEHRS